MRNNEDYRLEKLHEVCFKDLTNQKFGKLTVKGVHHKKGKIYYWECMCDCGKTTIVDGGSLRRGHTRSCGCLHKKALLKDLVGIKFGSLVVESYSKQVGKKHYWHCKCDCGNEIDADGRSLRAGNRISCGCARRTMKLAQRKYDLTNKRFGSLVAIRPLNHSLWECKCDCGNFAMYKTSDLIRGFINSCGCKHLNTSGSTNELELKNYICSLLPDDVEILKSRVLVDPTSKRKKEIDIYIPSLRLGIEYNGSAFHTSENSKFGQNKDKYYHRDKFLLARNMGIHLITVFDIDYESNKDLVLKIIARCIHKDKLLNPNTDTVITNNDYDDGMWLKQFSYK